ncbi:MAG: hypothetical protein JNL08_09265 [Planctomycetes bacterium]|nr:hypothetical protein [Planctomycetota bacterium]
MLLALAFVQPPVAVRVPAALPAAVVALLQERLGAAAAVTAVGEPVPPSPGSAVLLGFDEWTLARADAAVEAIALPFADTIVLVHDAAVAAGDTAPTWESVALDPALHDRLGLAGPEVDAATWLAALRGRLGHGGGEAAGIALWTTLDARAGRLAASAAAVVDGVVSGRFAAAIGPAVWFRDLPARAGGPLRASPLSGPEVRRGVAVTASADARTRALAASLAEPQRAREVAGWLGLGPAAGGPPVVTAAAARRWWQQFEVDVRGRGRGAEQLADWLDLAFGLGFLVCALLLWRALRKAPAP